VSFRAVFYALTYPIFTNVSAWVLKDSRIVEIKRFVTLAAVALIGEARFTIRANRVDFPKWLTCLTPLPFIVLIFTNPKHFRALYPIRRSHSRTAFHAIEPGVRPRALSAKQVQILHALAGDKTNQVDEVCASLQISRPTFYRYLKAL
jgi:hypothetical protein